MPRVAGLLGVAGLPVRAQPNLGNLAAGFNIASEGSTLESCRVGGKVRIAGLETLPGWVPKGDTKKSGLSCTAKVPFSRLGLVGGSHPPKPQPGFFSNLAAGLPGCQEEIPLARIKNKRI